MSNVDAYCLIVSNGGITPRAASSIVYTVAIQEEGQGPYNVAGVAPTGVRFPDTIDTVPAAVGSIWPVKIFAGRVYCFIVERPDLAECP